MALSIRTLAPAILLALSAPLTPAAAKITSVASNGFSVVQLDTIEASPEQIWTVLVEPSLWWNPDHSFTGEAIYFTLDAKPGGCFCEKIPVGETAGGGIRHFTIVYVDKPRVLRMEGALGPLQSEAVAATMTVAMEPREGGASAVSMSYVVGGYTRMPLPDMARALDLVTGEALARLKAAAEGRDPAKAVYVAEPLPVRNAPAEAAADDTSTDDTESAPSDPAEPAPAAKETDEGEATAPPPRPSLSDRLQLPLEEEDVELAGSSDAEEDGAQKADAEEAEQPRHSITPLPDGSR